MAVLTEEKLLDMGNVLENIKRSGEKCYLDNKEGFDAVGDFLDTIADLLTKLAAAEEREARLRKLVEKYGLTGYTVARVHKEQKP